jgi:hypothetical protein
MGHENSAKYGETTALPLAYEFWGTGAPLDPIDRSKPKQTNLIPILYQSELTI